MDEKLFIVIAQSTTSGKAPFVAPINSKTIEGVQRKMDEVSKHSPVLLLGYESYSIMEVTEMAFVKSLSVPEPDIEALLKSTLKMLNREKDINA